MPPIGPAFNARTYNRAVRTALAKALDTLESTPLPWSEFLDRFAALWRDMDRERFVTEFIGPNMVWQRDWAEKMLKGQGLPCESRLPERTLKRLCWQIQAEMTYLNRRGRTLERLGRVTLAPDKARLDTVIEPLVRLLRERYGAQDVPPAAVFHWLWGFLTHLRQRGAVWHPELSAYAGDAKFWALARSQGRVEWLPSLSERGADLPDAGTTPGLRRADDQQGHDLVRDLVAGHTGSSHVVAAGYDRAAVPRCRSRPP